MIYGLSHFVRSLSYESTDDAFIDGHIIRISTDVGGHVIHLHVTDNQLVHRGDLLVEIDPSSSEARVAQARAALEMAQARQRSAAISVDLTRITASGALALAEAGVVLAEADLAATRSQLLQSEAQRAATEADLEEQIAAMRAAEAEAVRAGSDFLRYQSLAQREVVSQQELDLAVATARAASAELDAARQRVVSSQAHVAVARAARQAAADVVSQAEARVSEAQARLVSAQSVPEQVGISEAQVLSAQAEVEQASAELRQAEIDLAHTRITAPRDGHVTRRLVEEGDYIQPGEALLAIVPPDVWVTANFKETQLTHMRPGQPVLVEVDAHPGVVFHAHVDSIQAGTGARFSLLPPENATGNFVKVVQRVPVKIVFDEPPDPQFILVPGMSVVPQVRIR
ncbi:HlyD family secretion protein [Candidatus Sumerlaeota bacterium]|nr:HlyD family secretion protein [Candidatus Sumerlaeota bacterium]